MRNITLISLILLGSVLFFSCQKDKEDSKNVNTGYVKGTVITPSGVVVPAASVFVDDEGEIYFAKTDKNGNFYLQCPEGEQVLNIQTGDGSIFRAQYNISVKKDEVTNLPANTLRLTQAAQLAYIPGAYDQIEVILIDSLGYSADMLAVSDLSNLQLLESYDALFLNCGKSGSLDSTKYANLKSYVLNGGNIYASDWAVEYLTGDGMMFANNPGGSKPHEHIQTASPKSGCGSPEAGGFIEDSILCTDKEGPTTMVNGAVIVNPDIQAFLGQTSLDIEYDLGGWEVIKDLLPPFEVLISDPNTYGPLAIRMTFPSQNGSKNMLDQGWVTICHIPPGNPANAHTITVSVNALPAHLAHGDYIGPCSGGAGTIYYTTFHNHVQGAISHDVYQMLQYFILSL